MDVRREKGMRSFKLLENRARYVVAAVGLFALGVVAPVVSAAQVTERSVQLSSAAKEATGVSYKVTFTPVSNAGGFVLDFCSNTPLVGEECTTPTGFVATSATTSTPSWTRTVVDANIIKMTGNLTASTPVTVDIDNIENPDVTGAFYVRIVSYATSGDLANYVSADVLGNGVVDTGGVALYIHDKINVSGAVLESMTFCVSGETLDPAQTCVGTGANAPALTAPTLRLGEETGDIIALNADDVYEGTIYTQLSTNAAKGAVIRLKSNAVGCGGLLRSSDTSVCNIGPAGVGVSDDITAGQAEFGLKLGADVTDATNGDIVAASTDYNSTNFRLKYAADNQSGVTSTYGDPILDTNEKPANKRNMSLTFGASVSNNTPAGNYSADLSLVATGKF